MRDAEKTTDFMGTGAPKNGETIDPSWGETWFLNIERTLTIQKADITRQ
jgi:hypothetical protein